MIFGTIAAVLLFGDSGHRDPLVGKVAPDLHGEVVAGDSIDLAQERGRWVVVNFFAPWCTECIVEHPELQRFVARHASDGTVRFVSVVVDTTGGEASDFFARHPPAWTYLMDRDGPTGVAYGQAKVPETFVIAPNGTIVARFTGTVTSADLDDVIA